MVCLTLCFKKNPLQIILYIQKRVSQLKRQYFWTGIKDTPFTLVITYPHEYGVNRIQIKSAEDEIHRLHARGDNIVNYFQGQRWRIHPEWLYCKHSTKPFDTAEEELLYFLKRMSSPGWKWPLNRTRPPPEHAIYCKLSFLYTEFGHLCLGFLISIDSCFILQLHS